MKKTFFTIFLFTVGTMLVTGCSLFENTEKITPKNQVPEKLEVEITPEEKEFNNSGRAKAIENETDLWQLYDNPELGISFQYPHNVVLLPQEKYPENLTQTYLAIDIRDIGHQDAPIDLNEEDAMTNIETLSGGEFGIAQGFALEPSQQVRTVGFLFAQDYMTLGRFEVCNVALERNLRFYFNNKQVTLTLFGPIDSLRKSMPKYFTVNQDNCGEDKIWIFDKQAEFYTTLVNGSGSTEIQQWFDDFDKIAETIIFAHR